MVNVGEWTRGGQVGIDTSPTRKSVLGGLQVKSHSQKGVWRPPGKTSVMKDLLNDGKYFQESPGKTLRISDSCN